MLEKFPDYWKGAVKFDRVVYRPIVEDQARLTELLTGTLDLIVGVPPDFVAQLEGSPKANLLKQVGAHVWYLGINNTKKPLDDKRVRQALNYAVNKDAIVKDVLKGTGAVSRGPVLPGTWGADPNLAAYPYDPAQGEEAPRRGGLPERLLDHHVGAGVGLRHAVAGGDGGRDAVEPPRGGRERHAPDHGVGRLHRQAPHQGAGALRAVLGRRLRGPGHGDVSRSSTRASGRPTAPTAPCTRTRSSTPSSREARQVTDQAKRAALYREAQRILVEDAPWVFVDHEIQIAATSKRVQGFKLHPSFDLRVETISLR